MNENVRQGTVIPNRIFVGGLSPATNEQDLLNTFERFGRVLATKIIADRAGVSKGYGFVTFSNLEEAKRALEEGSGIILRDRKLNVAQAFRKSNMSSSENPRAIFLQTYSNPLMGRENLYLPAVPLSMPTYCYGQYPQAAGGACGPFFYSMPSTDSAGLEQSIEEHDMGKLYSKQNSIASASGSSDSDTRSMNMKSYLPSPNNVFRYGATSSPIYQNQPVSLHHYMPKTLNGMAIMAYPSSFMMSAPTILHVKENNSEQESLMSELSYLQSPISVGALTPPPTPLASVPCDFGPTHSHESIRKN